MVKILLVNPDSLLENYLTNKEGYYKCSTGTIHSDEFFKSLDLILLSGGTDISSSLYHTDIKNPPVDTPDSKRDLYEIQLIKRAFLNDIPIVGICRGAQLLHVMNGGNLIPHDTTRYHLTSHPVLFKDNTELMLSANHHQIMIDNYDNTEAWCTKDGHNEVMLYPETRSLCWQPHPEWEPDYKEHTSIFTKYVNKITKDNVNISF
jgi:putative glutamine amidotransferase